MKFYVSYLRPALFIFLFGLCLSPLAEAQKKTSLFDLLTKDEGNKITIGVDLTTLIQQKRTNNYFPATLATADGTVRQLQIKPRGKYRRKTCELPPMKLKFSNKALVAEGLDTLNEIKLVLPCSDSDNGDDLLIKEYIIYKMYEKLTPASIRARLVKITMKDTHVEKSKKAFYGILLEDVEELAVRLGTTEHEQYGIEPDSLQINQAALMVMFQYMIGNQDWEIAMMRNIHLLKSKDSGKVFAVPYDFDFSGFVSAPYSSPSSESGVKTVRDRFLMSSGISTEALKRATKLLKARKSELLEVCRSKQISREVQAELIAYLETFFTKAESTDEMPTVLRMAPPTD